jgi:branched-chain amino acid transport system permease protein
MNPTIALLLAQDGITNGIAFALLAVAMLLVFLVTRILFVAQGEFVVLGAITTVQVQRGEVAGAAWLLISLAILCILLSTMQVVRERKARNWYLQSGICILSLGIGWYATSHPPAGNAAWVQIASVLSLVTPMGPLLYWTAFRNISRSSILTLLFAAMCAHYILQGLMLPLFGPEGFRALPLVHGRIDIGGARLSAQLIFIFCTFLVLTTGLWLFFRYTLSGKALRAISVNRIGARLVGISSDISGATAFGLASFIGAISGILIAPLSNIYYDSGFLLALKGFVGCVVGGLASFPLAALGAILTGLLDSFSSFYASAFRDSIVFALLVPILLYMSVTNISGRGEETEE